MIGRTECRSSSCHNALGIRSQNSGIETQSRATHVEFDLQKRHGCDPKTATSSYPSSAARCLRGPTGVSDNPTPTEHFLFPRPRKPLAEVITKCINPSAPTNPRNSKGPK